MKPQTNQQIQLTQPQTLQLSEDISKGLTVIEKEIAVACLQKKVKDYAIEEVCFFMLGLIGRTHLSCGFKMDESNVDLTVDEFCADLKKYNGLLSFEELEIAFKNGWKKTYGDFTGLNNATYFQWVNGYTWSQSRLNAKKALENAKNKPVSKPKLSEEEKERIIKEGALKMFEDYKSGATILDPGNVVYNYLGAKGLIRITPERRDKLLAEEKERMIQEAIANKGTKSVAKVIEGVIGNEAVIIGNAKRQALKEYFSHLIELGMNLKEELNG